MFFWDKIWGGFKYCLFLTLKIGEVIQFDSYLFHGLKPPPVVSGEALSWIMVSSWWVTALRMAWTTGRWRETRWGNCSGQQVVWKTHWRLNILYVFIYICTYEYIYTYIYLDFGMCMYICIFKYREIATVSLHV